YLLVHAAPGAHTGLTAPWPLLLGGEGSAEFASSFSTRHLIDARVWCARPVVWHCSCFTPVLHVLRPDELAMTCYIAPIFSRAGPSVHIWLSCRRPHG